MGARASCRAGSGEVLLAFDFGLRRIGIASGNLLTRTASPLTTLHVGREFPWAEFDRLIEDWRPSRLVVGMPPSGGAANIGKCVRSFVTQLRERYALDVATVDESLTSIAAYATLREHRRSGLSRRRIGKDRLDRHAACLIAEQWLSEPEHELRADQ
ncbi:Holliday junction resolvase RuvX [Candidatus Rariloculus sp.]|uniref:Holliday junction resolvase RuvX n=1 Tax=Candidatus Rariloculus sp. TaxID=3101265 RepID=UPI003D13849C